MSRSSLFSLFPCCAALFFCGMESSSPSSRNAAADVHSASRKPAHGHVSVQSLKHLSVHAAGIQFGSLPASSLNCQKGYVLSNVNGESPDFPQLPRKFGNDRAIHNWQDVAGGKQSVTCEDAGQLKPAWLPEPATSAPHFQKKDGGNEFFSANCREESGLPEDRNVNRSEQSQQPTVPLPPVPVEEANVPNARSKVPQKRPSEQPAVLLPLFEEAKVPAEVPQKRPSESRWAVESTSTRRSDNAHGAASSDLIVDDKDFPTLSASSVVGRKGKSRPGRPLESKPKFVEPTTPSAQRGGDKSGRINTNQSRRILSPGGWGGDGMVQRRQQSYRTSGEDKSIENLGRTLTKLLRHEASQMNLVIRSDGYVQVEDLLKVPVKTASNRWLSSHSIADLSEVVALDKKQRFGLKEENGKLLIRASQGHTIQTVMSEELLKPILSAENIPECVHGTYREHVVSILAVGLKKMKRNHVHFATGKFGSDNVISGMRRTSEVLVYLDLQKALDDGMKFFISDNGVVLTEGFDGVVPPRYFLKVLELPDLKPIKI